MGALRTAGQWGGTVLWTGLHAAEVLALPAERVPRISRAWARGVGRLWGFELVVHGAEAVDPRGTYVFMANHQSWADIPVLFSALPVIPGFLAKQELAKIPLLGRAMRAAGHVFVDRGRHQAALDAVRDAARQMQAGLSVAVFPEGTRGEAAEIRRFKKGGFHLAKAARVPIVPVGLRGTRAILPKHHAEFTPGVVEAWVGQPISAADVEATPIEGLVERTRAEISRLSAMPLADRDEPRRG